jgi:hypothetical protein
MDLKLIVVYLNRKELSAKNIHFDIVHAVEPDVIYYLTMILYFCDARCADLIDPEAAPDHNHEPDNTD